MHSVYYTIHLKIRTKTWYDKPFSSLKYTKKFHFVGIFEKKPNIIETMRRNHFRLHGNIFQFKFANFISYPCKVYQRITISFAFHQRPNYQWLFSAASHRWMDERWMMSFIDQDETCRRHDVEQSIVSELSMNYKCFCHVSSQWNVIKFRDTVVCLLCLCDWLKASIFYETIRLPKKCVHVRSRSLSTLFPCAIMNNIRFSRNAPTSPHVLAFVLCWLCVFTERTTLAVYFYIFNMKQQPIDWCEFCGKICRFFSFRYVVNLNVFWTHINITKCVCFFWFCINFNDLLDVSIWHCLTYTWPSRNQFRADIWALSQINCVIFFSSGKTCFVLSEFRHDWQLDRNIESARVFFLRFKENKT